MAPIFVRHGRSRPDPAVPTDEWELDPDGLTDIKALAGKLPRLPVVCSGMRRAVDTAAFFGAPKIDDRLAEVERPFVDDPRADFKAYLSMHPVEGWEPAAEAIARFEAAVADHGDAIYVTHGTILSVVAAARCPGLDAYAFWTDLRNPDAWVLDGDEPRQLA